MRLLLKGAHGRDRRLTPRRYGRPSVGTIPPSSNRSPNAMTAFLNSALNADERSRIEALRTISASLRDLPSLIRIVRSTYRAGDRKPHLEPAYINWVERYVRFYQTKPLGMLDDRHVTAFLTHLARRPGISPSDQEQALDALQFFHEKVLHAPLGPIDDYTRVHRRRQTSSEDASGRSFWDVEDGTTETE